MSSKWVSLLEPDTEFREEQAAGTAMAALFAARVRLLVLLALRLVLQTVTGLAVH